MRKLAIIGLLAGFWFISGLSGCSDKKKAESIQPAPVMVKATQSASFDSWTRTDNTSGGPVDLSSVTSIEIHADVWNYGYTFWLDGMIMGTVEITENNASQWGTIGNGSPVVTNDTSDVKVGLSSIKFDTGSGNDSGCFFPGDASASWDMSKIDSFYFWMKFSSPNNPQINIPKIVLTTASGGKVTLAPKTNMAAPNWTKIAVPLQGVSISVSSQFGDAPLSCDLTVNSHYLNITEYRIDTNGDGTDEITLTSAGTTSTTYQAGSYETKLSATDVNGNVWTDTVNVSARRPVPFALKPKALCLVYGGTIANAQNMAQEFVDAISWSTGGLVDFQIVEVIEGASFSGSTLTEKLTSLVQNNNVPARVEAGEVDELFVFDHHADGLGIMVEAWSYGRGAFWLNGVAIASDECRMFAAYTFNVDRGVGCMLENTSHRIESTMKRVYGSWTRGNVNGHAWDRFTLIDKDAPGKAAVGFAHYPPNALSDYDYNNSTIVWSTADDWLNYPNLTGLKRQLNADEWNILTGDNDCGGRYHKWWMLYIPRAQGVGGDDNDGKENNWWKYIIDYNRYADLVGQYATNPMPTSYITLAPTTAGDGVSVTFEGYGKVHPASLAADTPSKLVWNFGDGTLVEETVNVTQSNPSSVTHTFTSSGTFEVTLVSEDSLGFISFVAKAQVKVISTVSDLAITQYGDTNGWFGETRNQRALIVNEGGVNSPQTSLNVYISTDTTLDAADTLINTLLVPALELASQTILDYSITIPTDWPTRSVYVIVVVDPDNTIVETDETNNSGYRKIGLTKLIYDVDGDGFVTITDIFTTAGLFGAVPGDLKWNSSADINGDGAITISDIFAVAGHFGDAGSHVEIHASAGPTSGAVPLQVTFNYNAYFFEGSVTKVEIDFGDGSGWQMVATGSSAELNGSYSYWYTSVGSYATKIRATDSNGYVDETSGPTITVQ